MRSNKNRGQTSRKNQPNRKKKPVIPEDPDRPFVPGPWFAALASCAHPRRLDTEAEDHKGEENSRR